MTSSSQNDAKGGTGLPRLVSSLFSPVLSFLCILAIWDHEGLSMIPAFFPIQTRDFQGLSAAPRHFSVMHNDPLAVQSHSQYSDWRASGLQSDARRRSRVLPENATFVRRPEGGLAGLPHATFALRARGLITRALKINTVWPSKRKKRAGPVWARAACVQACNAPTLAFVFAGLSAYWPSVSMF